MMKKDRFKALAAVYLLLFKDDKVLLLRRFNTGWSDGLYSIVAGHLDGGETLTVAMTREALEEAGITIDPQTLQLVHVMHRMSDDKLEYLDFYFTTSSWEGEPTNMEPEKCDDLSWFPVNHLPDNILPYVREVIMQYKSGNFFSEIGWG